jgi:cAMP-specific phosphodiesterase 4
VAGIYRQVTYHNFYHCTDVTHTTFMFIKRVAHKVALTELEKFALMVAAVAHDMDHPGVNNAFLVNCKDLLAVTYNDSSVLENRHVACLYSLLPNRPEIDILGRLETAQWREVGAVLCCAVLSCAVLVR